MRLVVHPFHRFSTLFVSNVYLLDGGPGDRWLIDSGHWTERWQLGAELRRSGFRPSELTGVLLTFRAAVRHFGADGGVLLATGSSLALRPGTDIWN